MKIMINVVDHSYEWYMVSFRLPQIVI